MDIYYDFAKDNYISGVPKGNFPFYVVDENAVNQALNEDIPHGSIPLEAVHTEVSVINYEKVVEEWLLANTEYVLGDYEYVDNGIPYHAYDIAPVPDSYPYNAKIQWQGRKVPYPPKNYVIDDTNPPYRADELFCYVDYVDPNVDPTVKLRWRYRFASNKYPYLHLPEAVDTGSFYPVIPLRTSGVTHVDPSLSYTPLYQSIKELCRYLDVSIDELYDGIIDNPDVDSVNQVYLMHSVSAYTETDYGAEYLYKFVDSIYEGYIVRGYEIADKEWKCTVDFDGITKDLVQGYICEENKYKVLKDSVSTTLSIAHQITQIPILF